MSILISILVLVAILIGAGCQLRRLFQVAKHGGCTACDYDCATKHQLKQSAKHL